MLTDEEAVMPNVFYLAPSRLAVAIVLAAGLAWPVAASAEVVKVSGNGFTVRETADIAAAPEKVYEALVKPEAWWSSDHTFSGSAANLSLDAKAGGCFCEALPNGGTVKHHEVILAAPGRQLVMRGALGPLQATGTIDAFAFKLDPDGSGTKLTVTFAAGGYVAEGFDDWAKKTDFVIATQAARLKQFVETGSPEAKK
jgi:uncharacterized protein YndB with AHSA1/START domain